MPLHHQAARLREGSGGQGGKHRDVEQNGRVAGSFDEEPGLVLVLVGLYFDIFTYLTFSINSYL